MIIRKQSPLTGKFNELDIPVTQEQIDKWQSGTLIQNAMPNLTTDEREFLITGYTPDDWEAIFGKEEE